VDEQVHEEAIQPLRQNDVNGVVPYQISTAILIKHINIASFRICRDRQIEDEEEMRFIKRNQQYKTSGMQPILTLVPERLELDNKDRTYSSPSIWKFVLELEPERPATKSKCWRSTKAHLKRGWSR
jgi:hypothetical protein